MGNLKKPLIFLSLTVLLTLQVFVFPVFSFSANNDYENVKFDFPEAELTGETAVFQKGLSYSAWSSDAFGSPESDESLSLLTETNTEWIAICFSWFQSSTTSHDIHLDPSRSPTTESVLHAITSAHNLGLKVMLKPMVEADDREELFSYPVWRGEIQPSNEWFESYSDFINFFADFAEQNNVEMFCVGCEYKKTTGSVEQWKNIIQEVRERYSGPITYAADWTNYQNIEWWSSVDYVGIDAYFSLSLFDNDPAFEELKTVWGNHADDIEEWLDGIGKPVIFTEIGYRSGDGTSMAPANYWTEMAVDLQEQVDCYEAAFQTLWDRNWFYGFYWWTWVYKPTDGGINNSGHSPQNKPVQDVITDWYSKEKLVAVIDQTYTSAEKCVVNEVQSVGFHVAWKHDHSDVVDARLHVNGTEYVTNQTGWIVFNVSFDKIGKRSWVVTDVQHSKTSSYILSAEMPSIIWDKVDVNIETNSNGFGKTGVRVHVMYDYTGDLVTGVITTVNGKQCEETEPGVYVTEVNSLNPFEQVTVWTAASGLPGETKSVTIINPITISVYVALVVLVVIGVMLFKRLRKRSVQSEITSQSICFVNFSVKVV